jgi:hypothetical protein
MLAYVGAEGLNGRPQWGNLLSSLAIAFQARRDDRRRNQPITEAPYTKSLTLPHEPATNPPILQSHPALERFPAEWNHSVEKKSLQIQKLEPIPLRLIQPERNML